MRPPSSQMKSAFLLAISHVWVLHQCKAAMLPAFLLACTWIGVKAGPDLRDFVWTTSREQGCVFDGNSWNPLPYLYCQGCQVVDQQSTVERYGTRTTRRAVRDLYRLQYAYRTIRRSWSRCLCDDSSHSQRAQQHRDKIDFSLRTSPEKQHGEQHQTYSLRSQRSSQPRR